MVKKTGFLGIRTNEEEEKMIKQLIDSGKAKDRRQAFEILTVAKYMQKDINSNTDDLYEEQQTTESNNTPSPESIPVKKPEESTAKILLDLYKDNKRMLKETAKGGNDFIEQLGYQYLNLIVQENESQRQRINELEERIRKMENTNNLWNIINEHWDDIMLIINELKGNNTTTARKVMNEENTNKVKKIIEKVNRL